jgi:hypothetical protein
VLRRILRRAVRYGWDVLKAPNGFFSRYPSVVFIHVQISILFGTVLIACFMGFCP